MKFTYNFVVESSGIMAKTNIHDVIVIDYSDNKAITLITSKITILVCHLQKKLAGGGVKMP